jgi:hypothetical protein
MRGTLLVRGTFDTTQTCYSKYVVIAFVAVLAASFQYLLLEEYARAVFRSFFLFDAYSFQLC